MITQIEKQITQIHLANPRNLLLNLCNLIVF